MYHELNVITTSNDKDDLFSLTKLWRRKIKAHKICRSNLTPSQNKVTNYIVCLVIFKARK